MPRSRNDDAPPPTPRSAPASERNERILAEASESSNHAVPVSDGSCAWLASSVVYRASQLFRAEGRGGGLSQSSPLVTRSYILLLHFLFFLSFFLAGVVCVFVFFGDLHLRWLLAWGGEAWREACECDMDGYRYEALV